jgi:hypothetical protein
MIPRPPRPVPYFPITRRPKAHVAQGAGSIAGNPKIDLFSLDDVMLGKVNERVWGGRAKISNPRAAPPKHLNRGMLRANYVM